ncbi:hypothetical protein AB0O34_33025 [Sphaerisporangium sp. NPDC088356]|uniref:hypothetical protein n=1 Tax=Sphaerisporangium sp. NPDC088356 TaxID=3154871 RepID=UPI003439CE89
MRKKRQSRRSGRNRPASAPGDPALPSEAGKTSPLKGGAMVMTGDHKQITAEAPPPGAPRRWSRSEVLKGAAITVVGGVFLGGAGWVIKQLVDVSAAGDGIRGTVRDDIRTTVEVVYLDDEGRSKAMASLFQPDADLTALMAKPGAAANPALDNRLRSLGAFHVGALSLRLTLEGRLNQEVRVLDISPVLMGQRSAPLDGTLFYMPPQEADPVMDMIFDMDALSLIAHEVNENGSVGRPFFEKNNISLPDTQQDTVIIRTFTTKHSITFFLRIQYRVGGEIRHMDIYDQGKPFHLTAMNCDRDQQARYRRAFALNPDFSLRAVSDSATLGCVAGYKQL